MAGSPVLAPGKPAVRTIPPVIRTAIALILVASGAARCSNPIAPPPPPPVVDAPSITCPSNVTASVDQAPAPVTYTTPVVMAGTAPVVTACTIESGKAFPSGTTDVICTATDAVARQAQCTFKVSVNVTARLKGTRFLAFGDSVTDGEVSQPAMGLRVVQRADSYPTQLEGLLRERYVSQAGELAVINEGIGGKTITEDEDRLRGTLRANRPDVLLFLHGTNDVNGRKSTVATDIYYATREAIIRAKSEGARLVLVSTLLPQVQGRSKAFGWDLIPEANDAIRDAVAREGGTLVDAFGAFNPQKELLIGIDGLHPTVAGYQLLAETFLAAIRANFEDPPPAPAELWFTPQGARRH